MRVRSACAGARVHGWCTHDGEPLRVWDVVERRRVLTDPPARTQRLLCRSEELTFTPENRALAARTADGVVTWDFHADRGRPLLPMPGEGVNSVEFDPTGAYVLSWVAAGLALWRTDSPAPADGGPRRPLITFPVETPAAADTQGRLTLWDAGGQHRIVVLAVADSTVERPAPAFSPTARCWPRAGTTARSACGRRRPRDGRERPCRPVTDPSLRSDSPRVRGSCTSRRVICRCVRHS
ncbi:WD40 repeat domain-containing protein [Streptomyces mirabilis]|uniref:hypothetical protein n=1 Tax=Streptomyces mirabilis TaxID=68239 RepID=UPI0033346DA2